MPTISISKSKREKNLDIISIKKAEKIIISLGGNLLDTGNGIIVVFGERWVYLPYKILDNKILFLKMLRKVFDKVPDRI